MSISQPDNSALVYKFASLFDSDKTQIQELIEMLGS